MPKPIGNIGTRPSLAKVEPTATDLYEQSQTLEQVLADRLVDEVDISAVARHVMTGLKRRFIDWLARGGSDTPIAEMETLRLIEGGEDNAA